MQERQKINLTYTSYVYSPRSVSPTAQRMVVLYAMGYDDGDDVDRGVIPVVAIEVGTSSHNTYETSSGRLLEKDPSPSDYCRLLIVSPGWCGIETLSDFEDVSNPKEIEIVVCSWPPEQDEAKFSPIFERLEAELVKEKKRKADK